MPRWAAALPLVAAAAAAAGKPPHIFFVIVDDFGWAEVGYHRSDVGQVSTATIDSLVKEGVELNRHYVHMMCTPTRAAFQSGRLPVHVTTSLAGPCDHNGAIPRNMTGVAQKLKEAGYATHHVGKWDTGMATPTHTPQGRGYDTSLNYFGHGNWMYTEIEWGGSKNNMKDIPDRGGIRDFWDTDKPAHDLAGTQYEEWVFRDRMHEILHGHDQSKPLFLNYCAKVAHYPLQAPKEYQDKFAFIDNNFRRMYHAMVNVLDDNLKNVTDTMKSLGMWTDTLMVLTGDNGGYVKAQKGDCNHTDFGGGGGDDAGHGWCCFNGEAGASNWPLRGGKYSPWEGGIRVIAFASGGFIPAATRGTKLEGIVHVADWYGTFCALAGVDAHDAVAAASGLPPVDSVDVWPMVSGANLTSPRVSILVRNNLLVYGKWKYATGTMIESERGGPQYPNASTAADPIDAHSFKCPSQGCLFDVETDPSEFSEVSAAHPDIVAQLSAELKAQSQTIWSVPHKQDAACGEAAHAKYGGFYGPWLELPAGQNCDTVGRTAAPAAGQTVQLDGPATGYAAHQRWSIGAGEARLQAGGAAMVLNQRCAGSCAYCSDGVLTDSGSDGVADCLSRCSDDAKCTEAGYWYTGEHHWCTTASGCATQTTQEKDIARYTKATNASLCLSASGGALTLQPCNGTAAGQRWATDGQLLRNGDGPCLSRAATGMDYALTTRPCSADDVAQQFSFFEGMLTSVEGNLAVATC